MSEAVCRQCGKMASLADFPTGEFVCPECGWRELMPNAVARGSRGRRGQRSEGGGDTGGGTATLEHPEDESPDHQPEPDMEAATLTDAEPSTPFDAIDVEQLGAMTGEAFTTWCARLLTRFGYVVVRGDGDDDDLGECDLRITRDGEVTFVDCVSQAPTEVVSRATCQRLVGAMVGAGVRRGIVMTPGGEGETCRAFIDRLGDDYVVDFIGGERLEETVQEMMTGPLAVWWKA